MLHGEELWFCDESGLHLSDLLKRRAAGRPPQVVFQDVGDDVGPERGLHGELRLGDVGESLPGQVPGVVDEAEGYGLGSWCLPRMRADSRKLSSIIIDGYSETGSLSWTDAYLTDPCDCPSHDINSHVSIFA